MNNNVPLSEDLLDGAESISKFIYGDENYRRCIYHLADKKDSARFQNGFNTLRA